METAVCARDKPSILAASGKFGIFKPETEQKTRIVSVEMNPTLVRMKITWQKCELESEGVNRRLLNIDSSYSRMLYEAIKSGYSAKDIESYCLVLAECQKEENFAYKAGLFLTALINGCNEDRFVIHTAHLAKPIHYIGHRNM